MRILMVVRPAAGGMRGHVLALGRGLVSHGHAVDFAAPPGSDVSQSAVAAGFTVHAIPLVGPLDPLRDPAAVLALRRVIRAGGFDVVHAHGFKAGLVGRLAARLAGVRAFVVTAHNHVLSRTDTPGATRARYRAVERLLAPLVARYIAVSDSIHRELVEGYGLPARKVVTVRNGVDAQPLLAAQGRRRARAELDLPSADAVVVGLAARFSTQKGLRHLIAATPELLAELRRDGRGLAVVLGGSGPLEPELRTQAAELGVTDAIRWPGYVEDVPRLLAALDIYVSPAETEALGLGLIEAAIAGVPTVATDVGGVGEVITNEQTGLLVPAGDSHALAAAVLRLVRDPELADRIAQEARRYCLRAFAPERMLEETIRAYEAVLAEGTHVGGQGS